MALVSNSLSNLHHAVYLSFLHNRTQITCWCVIFQYLNSVLFQIIFCMFLFGKETPHVLQKLKNLIWYFVARKSKSFLLYAYCQFKCIRSHSCCPCCIFFLLYFPCFFSFFFTFSYQRIEYRERVTKNALFQCTSYSRNEWDSRMYNATGIETILFFFISNSVWQMCCITTGPMTILQRTLVDKACCTMVRMLKILLMNYPSKSGSELLIELRQDILTYIMRVIECIYMTILMFVQWISHNESNYWPYSTFK